MARPRKASALDPFIDLNRKTAVLEREMTVQRAAMDRLKELATRPQQSRYPHREPHDGRPTR